jgi:Protein of unknown function (DUF1549)/Protein of unknown function (DUF1553)
MHPIDFASHWGDTGRTLAIPLDPPEAMLPNLSRLPILLIAFAVVAPCRADTPEEHWAFKAPKRPAILTTNDANPIDTFIRAKLKAAGLAPAPRASREQLIRRLTFDLTGLPPTPEETDAFVNDKAANAWEKVVDRLLASPRYGERWARHWLDLARYADTNGYEFDEPRPEAWRYRDYVIASFNSDKPYDRFVVEQLAGDEAFPGDPAALVATGFNLLGPDMTDSSDQAQRRSNTLNDMTDTAALAFLGLTVTCARCHDHKFEPIPQTDYFRLQAFFSPAVFRRDLPAATPAEVKAREAQQREYLKLTQPLLEEIARLEIPVRQRLYEAKLAKLPADAQAAHRTRPEKRTGGQLELIAETEKKVAVTDDEVAKAMPAEDKAKLDDLRGRLNAFDDKKPAALPVAIGLTDKPGPAPKTFVLERGELANKGAEVHPGYPAILLPNGKSLAALIETVPGSTGRRLTLAKWIASKDNPLTARVIVNRLWQHHFGRGLVGTPSDFGVHGEAPTHPELLDFLACELIAGGWKLKPMHKLILMSESYQQSSQIRNAELGIRNGNPGSPVAAALAGGLALIPQSAFRNPQSEDPGNRHFSHMTRRRLEGEAVRDSLLAVSGRLNLKMGGPGVVLPEASKAAGGSRPVPVTADVKEYDRRSVYLFSRRNLRLPFLEAFDLPDSNLSCPKRERSTTAPQALALLNSPEAISAAKSLAERLTKEAHSEDARIERAYRLTLGRSPSATELSRAKLFLKDSPLSELCRALLNLNEFVYLD